VAEKKTDMKNTPETLTKKQLEERQNAHPFAVPFLWLGHQKVIDNFIWLPVLGMIAMIALGVVYPQKRYSRLLGHYRLCRL